MVYYELAQRRIKGLCFWQHFVPRWVRLRTNGKFWMAMILVTFEYCVIDI